MIMEEKAYANPPQSYLHERLGSGRGDTFDRLDVYCLWPAEWIRWTASDLDNESAISIGLNITTPRKQYFMIDNQDQE